MPEMSGIFPCRIMGYNKIEMPVRQQLKNCCFYQIFIKRILRWSIIQVPHIPSCMKHFQYAMKPRGPIRVICPAKRYDNPLPEWMFENGSPGPQGFIIRMGNNNSNYG